MTDKIQLGKNIEKGARILKWVGEMAEELQRIGSIEKAADNARDLLVGTNKELSDAKDELVSTRTDIAAAKEKLGYIEKDAATREKQANDKADMIIKEAQDRADTYAKRVLADGNTLKEQHEAIKRAIDIDRQDWQNELQKIHDDIAVAQDEYDSIQEKIRATKKAAVDSLKQSANDLG